MTDKHETVDQETVEEDAFFNNDDVLVELGDDGDFPMDEELGDGEFIIEEGGELDGEEEEGEDMLTRRKKRAKGSSAKGEVFKRTDGIQELRMEIWKEV